MESTFDDEIVAAIRRRREAHAERLGHDVKKIIKDLQRRERESGVALVERPPRKPRVVGERSSSS